MKHSYPLATFYLVIAICSYFLGYTPLLVTAWITLLSTITYWYYARDKAAAIAGKWRVPENTLHLLSLCGGWPGGLIARHKLRHKTKKNNFRIVFWLTVIANIAVFSWLHTPNGNNLVRIGVSQIENSALNHLHTPQVINTVLRLTHYRNPVF